MVNRTKNNELYFLLQKILTISWKSQFFNLIQGKAVVKLSDYGILHRFWISLLIFLCRHGARLPVKIVLSKVTM